jgi:hypothetical protein
VRLEDLVGDRERREEATGLRDPSAESLSSSHGPKVA